MLENVLKELNAALSEKDHTIDYYRKEHDKLFEDIAKLKADLKAAKGE